MSTATRKQGAPTGGRGPQEETRFNPLGFLPWRDFFSLDVRSLALMRIGLALCLIGDWLDRLPDLYAHYSDHGIVPRDSVLGLGAQPISVHFYSGEVWFQAVLAALALLFALALLVGYKTPFVQLVSWFLLISVHARTPWVIQGGDQVLRLLLFWGLFLPLGACYSLDAADPARKPPSPRVLSIASAALILQICQIYWYAGAWKWAPEWHSEGTAVYQALQIDHFTTPTGQFLRQYPNICYVLTRSTVYLETFGPMLLFLPFYPALARLLVIGSFIVFHASLALCLELSNFPWVCMVAWLALVPTAFWDRIIGQLRTPQRRGLVLFHDPLSAGARRVVGWLQTFAAVPGVEVRPAQEPGGQAGRARQQSGWGLLDHEGKERFGTDALQHLLSLSPLFAVFAHLLNYRLFRQGAAVLLRWAARGGQRASRAGGQTPIWMPPSGILVTSLVVFCAVYVALWNLRTLDPDRNRWVLPEPMQYLGVALGLDQGWGLFAPFPGKVHGYYYVAGHQKDGVEVDVLHGGPLSTAKPALLSATYPNGRWRKIMQNLSAEQGPNNVLLFNFSRYFFDEWNRTHSGGEQLDSLQVVWMQERSVLPGQERPPPVVVPGPLYPPRSQPAPGAGGKARGDREGAPAP